MIFKCGCEVLCIGRPNGILRHEFRMHCIRHFGHIRSFEIENERMALVVKAYEEAKAK